jgi:hypothetical protein
MLQNFPAHTVHSAMHFQDFGFWPPEPVARGKKARPKCTKKSTHVEPAGEEEEYVFV